MLGRLKQASSTVPTVRAHKETQFHIPPVVILELFSRRIPLHEVIAVLIATQSKIQIW